MQLHASSHRSRGYLSPASLLPAPKSSPQACPHRAVSSDRARTASFVARLDRASLREDFSRVDVSARKRAVIYTFKGSRRGGSPRLPGEPRHWVFCKCAYTV
eukprot:356930-Chlamydomonas_euryale.AAC.8